MKGAAERALSAKLSAKDSARRVALEQARNESSQALQAVDESLRSLRATFENKLRKRRDALRSALGLVALVGDQDRAEGDPIVEDAMDTDEDFADVEPVSAHEASERRAELVPNCRVHDIERNRQPDLDPPTKGGGVVGGVVAGVFDELLGCTCVVNDVSGFTGTLSIRYASLTPLGVPITMRGWVDRVEGRKTFATGTFHHGETLCATAEGIFIGPRTAT